MSLDETLSSIESGQTLELATISYAESVAATVPVAEFDLPTGRGRRHKIPMRRSTVDRAGSLARSPPLSTTCSGASTRRTESSPGH